MRVARAANFLSSLHCMYCVKNVHYQYFLLHFCSWSLNYLSRIEDFVGVIYMVDTCTMLCMAAKPPTPGGAAAKLSVGRVHSLQFYNF